MMNKRDINISVALASYNGERYIYEQISSIIPQLIDGDELIVSDDGSTDGTIQIVKEFEKHNPSVKLLRGPSIGVFRNFENAISHCTNSIVFLSDQDDIWMEDKVETVMDAFNHDKSVQLVMHEAIVITDDGEKHGSIANYKKGLLRNIVKSCYWGCCMAFRRELLVPYIPFRVSGIAHDQLIGLLSEKCSGTVGINKALVLHRVHGDNVTHTLGLKDKIVFRLKLIRDYVVTIVNAKAN